MTPIPVGLLGIISNVIYPFTKLVKTRSFLKKKERIRTVLLICIDFNVIIA